MNNLVIQRLSQALEQREDVALVMITKTKVILIPLPSVLYRVRGLLSLFSLKLTVKMF
ncbi:hypothetical protein [Desulfosporosinus shakirovi]|uniref:hypothetical protein n=1 Tax=Desulfosporosinus shakirovi TaxID=2885154 RepID=UPI001E4108BE|nr:hypothetical protein [Desulfosporosinus sp. SRJS8]MCB8815119.1 hypothetical protein [Desulfosporosinus sp. SRJS8]